jgi:hypothetical protein
MTRSSNIAMLALLAGIAVAVPSRAAEAGARHDLHLSQTRLVVDGTTVALRIRVFEDDLGLALTRAAGSKTPVVISDSLVGRYLASHVAVRANGQLLTATVGGVGEESDAQNQRVRWVLFTYRADRPITALALRVAPFFELYDDQQNIVTAVRGASGPRRSLLFTTGEAGEQVVRF